MSFLPSHVPSSRRDSAIPPLPRMSSSLPTLPMPPSLPNMSLVPRPPEVKGVASLPTPVPLSVESASTQEIPVVEGQRATIDMTITPPRTNYKPSSSARSLPPPLPSDMPVSPSKRNAELKSPVLQTGAAVLPPPVMSLPPPPTVPVTSPPPPPQPPPPQPLPQPSERKLPSPKSRPIPYTRPTIEDAPLTPKTRLPVVSPPVYQRPPLPVVSPPMEGLPVNRTVSMPLRRGESHRNVLPESPQHRAETKRTDLAMPLPIPPVPKIEARPIESIYTAPAPQIPAYGIGLSGGAGPSRPERPNYAAMSRAQQEEMHSTFRVKFGILRQSFPAWAIVDPPADTSLDNKHSIYEGYVRQIIISLNCNQWKVYLVIMFLAIEVFCIKVLGLDARGFTMSQVKIMQRYDQVLVELGEKYYVQGASNWPVEARIVMMAGFNGIIFIIVKYLSKWLGTEDLAGPIQGAINSFLSGNGVGLLGQQVTRDNLGIPILPGAAPGGGAPGGLASPGVPPPGAEALAGSLAGGMEGNPLAGLSGLLNQFMGGAGGGGAGGVDISSVLANLGNALTGGMAPRGAPGGAAPGGSAPGMGAAAGGGRGAAPPPRRMPRFDD